MHLVFLSRAVRIVRWSHLLAGIGRVVYGTGEKRLKEMTGVHPENQTKAPLCRIVFEAGQRVVPIKGPLLEKEGAQLHHGFW